MAISVKNTTKIIKFIDDLKKVTNIKPDDKKIITPIGTLK